MSGRTRRGRNPLFFHISFGEKHAKEPWRSRPRPLPLRRRRAQKSRGERRFFCVRRGKHSSTPLGRATPSLPPSGALLHAGKDRPQRLCGEREGILCAAQQSRASNPACARSERAGTFKSAGRARFAESKRRPAETSRTAMSPAGPASAGRIYLIADHLRKR